MNADRLARIPIVPLALHLLSPEAISARLDDLVRVYLGMYALPPAAGPRFAANLREQLTWDGVHLCDAFGEDEAGMIGFGYGFTGRPGQAWRDGLAAAMESALSAVWLMEYFEFAEFGVLPDWRGRGVGSQIHDRLLVSLPHRHAVLTVRQGNQVARAFYERRGWVALEHDFVPASGRGRYVIMGHELSRAMPKDA